MGRLFTLAFLGSFMALSSSSLLHAQNVQPISFEDLMARLETVESGLATKQDVGARQDFAVRPASSGRQGVRGSGRRGVRGGWFVAYENVSVKPYFSENVAYEILDAVPSAGESAQIVEFDWDFKNSPRVEIGYITPGSGFGWRARYWQFDSSISRVAADPFPADGRIQVGLQDDPDIEVSTGNNEFVLVEHSIKLDVLDMELMKRWETARSSLTCVGGLRYLRSDQKYQADFRDNATGVSDDILESRHFFEGIGPTCALEGTRRFGSSSWSAFGKTRGSFLLGDSGLRETLIDPQTPLAPLRELVSARSSTDFQFIAEFQVGVRGERRLSNGSVLFTSLGTELQYWPSGGSGAVMRGEDDGTTGDPRNADMLLLGISSSFGINW